MRAPLALALAAAVTVVVRALDNGAARTPPMGWMTWNHFRCTVDAAACAAGRCVSAALLATTADALVETGLAAAGYAVVALDDCWAAPQRAPDGALVADPVRFPGGGLAQAAAAVRARGLRFGVYTDVGSTTCAGRPGSRHHYAADAALFVSVGATYVKADGCNIESDDLAGAYKALGAALRDAAAAAAAPPMTYSCSWPAYLPDPVTDPNATAIPYRALIKHCNLWRNTVDVDTSTASVTAITRWYAAAARASRAFARAPRPGAWHDPDQLLVGEPTIPFDVAALQLAVWATMGAPLFLSADVRTMDAASVALAGHPTIVGINQDRAGAAPLLLAGGGDGGADAGVAWARPLAGGRAAVVAANTGEAAPLTISLHLPRSALAHGGDGGGGAAVCWREVDLTRAGVVARRHAWLKGGSDGGGAASAFFRRRRRPRHTGRRATVRVQPLTARLFVVEPCGEGGGVESD